MAFGLDLGNLLVHLRADASQYDRIMNNAVKRMRAASKKLTAIGRKMTMRVTLPLLALAAAATKAFASFDDAMTKSLAILGDVSPQMRKEMEKVAIDISRISVTSATELAKAYFYLASAGLSAEQSIMALAAVERFAVAGAFDMALATDLITDAQSALGLTVKDTQKNLENIIRVSDVLVAANTLANATVQQFSESLTSQAGPAMKAYNIDLEEGVAVLAAYADQGIKAQLAGSMFSRMLRLMTKGFLDNRAEWERLNINIFDALGELRPLADIINELTDALADMSTEQKIVSLNLLGFQARSQQAILPLIGLGDQIRRYNEELLDMAGITQDVYEKQLKSFSSEMKIVWNNVKALGRDIGSILAPAISKLGTGIVKLTRLWDTLNGEQKQSILIYAGVAAAIGPVLLATGLLLKTLTFMIGTVKILTGLFTGLGTAMAAPYLPILFLISAAYILRATWIQNLGGIRDAMEKWFNNFKEGFDWLMGPVSEFLTWFAKGFITTFDFVIVNFRGFISDLAGTLAGTVSWIKKVKDGIVDAWSAPTFYQMIDDFKRGFKEGGEAFAITFVGAKEKTDAAFEVFKKSIISGYETVGVVLSEINAVVGDDFKEVFGMVKKQIAEDMRSILDLVLGAQKEMKDAMSGTEMGDVVDFAEKWLIEGTGVFDKIIDFAEKWLIEGTGVFDKIVDDALNKAPDAIKSFKEKAAGYLQSWADEALQTVDGVFINMAEAVGSALTGVSEELTNLVLKGKTDFNSLAHSILYDLTQVIIKAQMAKVLMSWFGMGITPVAVPSPVYMVKAPTGHGGGIVGQMSASRYVPASVFEGASRYHNGLALDEVPTILQKGEKVLSKDDVAQMDGGRGDIYNVYISAIDKRGVYEFFNENQNLVASSIQGARRGNHPLRRM